MNDIVDLLLNSAAALIVAVYAVHNDLPTLIVFCSGWLVGNCVRKLIEAIADRFKTPTDTYDL